jgi:hypothetical protein
MAATRHHKHRTSPWIAAAKGVRAGNLTGQNVLIDGGAHPGVPQCGVAR